jgi:hypothetical protein
MTVREAFLPRSRCFAHNASIGIKVLMPDNSNQDSECVDDRPNKDIQRL